MSAGAGLVAPLPAAPERSTVSEDFMLKRFRGESPRRNRVGRGIPGCRRSRSADRPSPPRAAVSRRRRPGGGAARPVPAARWRRGRAIVRSGYGARAEGGYRPQAPRLGAGDRRGTGRPRRPGDRGAGGPVGRRTVAWRDRAPLRWRSGHCRRRSPRRSIRSIAFAANSFHRTRAVQGRVTWPNDLPKNESGALSARRRLLYEGARAGFGSLRSLNMTFWGYIRFDDESDIYRHIRAVRARSRRRSDRR